MQAKISIKLIALHKATKQSRDLVCVYVVIHNVSVNSNWVHPLGNPRGLAQKHCPGGRNLNFESCPGAGIRQGPGFCEK